MGNICIKGSSLRDSTLESLQGRSTRTGREIDESPSLTVEDVVTQLPNVSTTYGLTLRGISLFGPNGGNSRTSGVSIDGVPADNFGQEVAGLSAWDIARIDVLRSPDLTGLEQQALAGSVRIKTRDPTDAWDLRGRISASHPTGHNLAVAGGGPLNSDAIAVRISAEEQRDDGAVYNLTRGDARWNRDDRRTVRGKLRLRPDGTDYSALLTLADLQRVRGSPWVESLPGDSSSRVSLSNDPSLSRGEQRSVSLEQSFGLAGIQWTMLSTWANLQDQRHDGGDDLALRQGTSSLSHDDHRQTHALRGSLDKALGPGRMTVVVGGLWAEKRVRADSRLSLPAADFLTELGVCASQAVCDALHPGESVLRGDVVALNISNQAVFSEVDYRQGPFRWIAGLRYEHELQSRRIGGVTSGDSVSATATVDELIRTGVISPNESQDVAVASRVWLPRLGVQYLLEPGWTVGLNAQRGLRTGGVNFNRQSGPQRFGPEFTHNYELSVKGLIGDDMLLAMNAYRVDWRHQQVDIGDNDLTVSIVNAGRSRQQGLEFEWRGRASRGLELFIALGLSRASFTDFTSVNGNFSGKEFTLSPRRTASVGGTWTQGPLTIHLNVGYEGPTFSDPGNDPRRKNPSHALSSGKLSYALGHGCRVFLAGLNLLDKRYVIQSRAADDDRQLVVLGSGRTLRAGFEAVF